MAVKRCPAERLCEAGGPHVSTWCWGRVPKGLWPQLCQHEAGEAGKIRSSSPLWGGVRLPMQLKSSHLLQKREQNASYLLLRTFLSKYSFQPSEMAWIFFLVQNREIVGQEPVPKKASASEKGLWGPLSGQHRSMCDPSAHLPGLQPSWRAESPPQRSNPFNVGQGHASRAKSKQT